MSITRGFWSKLATMLVSLFGAAEDRKDTTKASNKATPEAASRTAPKLEVTRAEPASSVESTEVTYATALVAAAPESVSMQKRFCFAARLAVTARLNRIKDVADRSRTATKSGRNHPMRSTVAKQKRSPKRPVWIGAELRTNSAKAKSANVLPFRKPITKSASRPQAQPQRRAA